MSRTYCPKCEKAIAACFCHKLKKYNIDSQIIILRHPTEKGHPLGTAKIAELSLDKCITITDEDFSQNDELNQILSNESCYLVFPTDNGQRVPYESSSQKKKTFIFIDGTWKKAKKILYLNPKLSELPTITIRPSAPSHYILRKEPREDYLSTLEAICECVKKFEGKDIFQTLDTLKYIQQFQIDKMGIENFKRFYLKD